MKQKSLLRSMLLLFALIVGIGSTWGQTYDKLTSIANIDGSADYVLGIDGTGFHYSETSGWGLTALPSAQTPIYYTLTKNSNNDGFTAQATISNTTYYLTVPTSRTFTMSTSSTEIGMGTNGEIVNKSSTSWMIRRNGDYGLRAYSTSTGDVAYFYKVIPAFSLTAVSNNTSWGTVSVSGNKITANPSTGYRVSTTTPYTVTSGSATVVQNNNEFTVTANAACTVRINFEAIPTYTVTFNAEGGSCGTSSLTESLGGQGVTLPAATISVAGWVFVGWAESTVTQTTTIPTLYVAGSKYYPTAATTLHAVYTLSATGTTYTRLTSLNQINAAKKIAVASTYGSKILTHDASVVSAPSESSGEITVTSSQIFELSGNNTTGFVLTGSSGTLSQPTMPTSGSSNNEKPIGWDGTNNKWIIEENTYATNVFAVRNANSTQVALEYDSGWKSYYVSTYTSSQYTAMKLYLPKTAYNSNPSAITEPSVAFDNGNNGTTLYLDGTKTYTNAANVTGVTKPITYSSSDTNVAEVDATGKVTAKAIGTATITASVEAELGVSAPASATYDVVVKTTTTINGLKPLSSSSTEVNFSADLTDAVVTYVNGNYAYIQDASAAIMVNYSGHGLVAGKKINGAVSGKVKAPNQIDQISSLDLTEATVTTDGVIPEAVSDKTLAQIKAAGTDYDGKLVTINGATVTTGMTNATSGGKISDDNGTTTFNIIAPNNLTLKANEKGNFTGFVSIYVSGNTTTYRLNLYEQSQFVKTHNAPTAQTLTFEEDAVELDEDTEAYANFTGQQVSGAKGTVSYAKTSDENNIITSLNAETGAVVLSGAYGTATIEVTAAAIELTEGGVITPYTETKKTYTITVYPRYSVVFSINGVETTVRQEEHGASIAVVSKPDDIGAYKFQGWVENEVAAGSSKPESYVALSTTYTPTANKIFYAVYALEAVLPDVEQTSTFSFSSNSSSSAFTYVNGEITWSSSAVSSDGLKSQSLTFTPSNKVSAVKEIELSKNSNAWGQTVYVSLTDADNTEIFKIYCNSSATNNFDSNNKYTKDLTNYQSSSYKLTSNGNAWLSSIKVTYLAPGFEYSDYRTSITVPETTSATIAASGYTTFCSPYDLSFENVDGLEAAYVVSASTNAVATLKRVTAVPGGTGVVLKGTTGGITIPIVEYTGDEISNLLLGTLKTTTVKAESVYVVSGGKFKIFDGTSIPAGKAYLPISAVSTDGNAPSLSFEFDDETTNIVNVNRATINDNQYYTLDGRRVAQPTKGLYILNGKKVVVK